MSFAHKIKKFFKILKFILADRETEVHTIIVNNHNKYFKVGRVKYVLALTVSQMDRRADPKYRKLRLE